MASFQVLCVFLQSFITAELQVPMNIYHSCHVLLPTGHSLPANTHSHVVVLVLKSGKGLLLHMLQTSSSFSLSGYFVC